MKQRVQKIISQSGYTSRRKAEELIKQQKVKVNNKTITLGDTCTFEDKITIDNKPIDKTPQKIYIILNKKKGYITTKKDEYNRKTIFALLDKKDYNNSLLPIGRLDKETTGLLIITNDGDFAQKIIHPSSKIPKQYIAQINTPLNQNDKKEIESGLTINNIKLAPSKIKRLSQKKYLVTIYEGRKRQIREMFLQKNYIVENLNRIKIGNLDIAKYNLKQGEYKIITKEEIENQIFSKK